MPVLQRRDKLRTNWGDPYYRWRDATVEDLKDYYAELYRLQNSPTSSEFGGVPAVADLSKNTRSTGPK